MEWEKIERSFFAALAIMKILVVFLVLVMSANAQKLSMENFVVKELEARLIKNLNCFSHPEPTLSNNVCLCGRNSLPLTLFTDGHVDHSP